MKSNLCIICGNEVEKEFFQTCSMCIKSCYSIWGNGIKKKIETWNIAIPLHDNSGNQFDISTIETILARFLNEFPGITIINSSGMWKGKSKRYTDENFLISIDVKPFKLKDSVDFFSNLKYDLKKELDQEKIYIIHQNSRSELLSYKEFLEELNLSLNDNLDRNMVRKIVEILIDDIIPNASTLESLEIVIMKRKISADDVLDGMKKEWKDKTNSLPLMFLSQKTRSFLKMIRESLEYGILRRIELTKGYNTIESVLLKRVKAINDYRNVICLFWEEVIDTLPHALWKNGDPSTEKLNMKSKLVQLVGIRAMGRFMDYELGRLLDRYNLDKLVNHDSEIKEEIRRDLTIISKDCYFERVHEIPEGSPLIWWKTLSNNESDIRRLSDFMKEKIWIQGKKCSINIEGSNEKKNFSDRGELETQRSVV